MSETFTWNPRYSAQVKNTPNVRKAQFGGGYSQRVSIGINPLTRVWSVSFKLDSADIDAIDAFLTARKGVESFVWQPPNGASGLWLCPDWSRTADDGYNVVTATFEEIFGD